MFDSISLPTPRRPMMSSVNEHQSLFWFLHNIKLDSTDINQLGERYATTVSGWMLYVFWPRFRLSTFNLFVFYLAHISTTRTGFKVVAIGLLIFAGRSLCPCEIT